MRRARLDGQTMLDRPPVPAVLFKHFCMEHIGIVYFAQSIPASVFNHALKHLGPQESFSYFVFNFFQKPPLHHHASIFAILKYF